MSIRSLGFDSKGQIKNMGWVPSGLYSFRGGMSLPTRRYNGSGNRMEGCFIWSAYADDTLYLLESLIWSEMRDVDNFFSKDIFGGFSLRFFTAESDISVWRNVLKFSALDDACQPHPIYLDRVDDAQLLDVILRWMHLERLKFERGGVFYKNLGLFLTNPNLEISPFLESLGYLLIGMETFYRG